MKAIIEMKSGGKMVIALDEASAPITVKNFVKLCKEDFYENLIFHRVIEGFMIQGGDPTGTGCGGSDEKIKGEFAVNGVKNDISHLRGVVSMARSQSFNSASSQFFIMHADGKFLDGQYAAFGKVIAGMEFVDEIASVKTDYSDRPVIDMRMKTVTLIEE